ncbi:UDP-N-acetylmuramyl-tripeptide synthetase [Enterococcus sp. LJL98]
MYTITIDAIEQLLRKNQLLADPTKEIPFKDHAFTYLSYDSREIQEDTLFFCKGAHFKEALLVDAIEKGVSVYLSEISYEVNACEILVTDIREAMALIAQAFYRHPQDKLIKIAMTGTKGKTTVAYFVHQILKDAYGPKVALFSSEETTTDGKNYAPSDLTTPEALVLYRQMAQAVENGLTHLVMEVSSQAYKTKRAFGLTFEVGIFLNISPDHISPIEHETFDDYFACKQELLLNSQQMILNHDSDHFDVLAKICETHQIPYVTYGEKAADYQVLPTDDPRRFQLSSTNDPFTLNGTYQLSMFGHFNHGNATAALLATALVNVPTAHRKESLAHCFVPGRMNLFELKNGALAFVDFAHNYLSLVSMGKFAKEIRPNGKAIVMTGSAGGKALSRRKDMGMAISEAYDLAVLTSDDPNFEDPNAIADAIQAYITEPAVEVYREMSREQAIYLALSLAKPEDVVIIAGKGTEASMKIKGENAPYPGDLFYTQQWIAKQ